MSRLDVDYVLLSERTDRLSQLVSMLNEEIGRISGYTATLDLFWDGDANAAYTASIGEDLVWMCAVAVRVRDAVKRVKEALFVYMENERQIILLLEGVI